MSEKTGIEELRHIVRNFDMCRESFNERWTPDELIRIHRAFMASRWDLYPDCWSERQVQEALLGKAPDWEDDESAAKYADFAPTAALAASLVATVGATYPEQIETVERLVAAMLRHGHWPDADDVATHMEQQTWDWD